MKSAMLVTVGVGPTVADGIAFAIRSAHPNFVLFLVTAESESKTLPEVVSKAGIAEGEYACRRILGENDVERCALDCAEAIRHLVRREYAPEEIVADFTSGTKAMSAGLVAAGLEQEVGQLSYVHGERGESGRVVSGTERSERLKPNRLMARRDLRRAIDLFNTLRYDTCIDVLQGATRRTALPQIREQAGALKRLSEAYRAWDRFDHKTALDILVGLTGEPNLAEWGLKKQVERHKAFLYRLLKEKYTQDRAVDLWNNAERRAGEGRFDDATARLYRLLEYIAQVKLCREHRGLETGNLDVNNLPEGLREAYGKPSGRSGRVELGLVEAYGLLRDLEDPVGGRFMEDFEASDGPKGVLGLRNNSILAHGFGPVGEPGYGRACALVRRYLDVAFEGWGKKATEAEFPNLKIFIGASDHQRCAGGHRDRP